jgi:hypothetical protein
MDEFEPGEPEGLALRWDGSEKPHLDARVDLDGDGSLESHELLTEGRKLETGIQLVSLDVPSAVESRPQADSWVGVRENQRVPDETLVSVKAAAKEPDEYGWQPGFSVADLSSDPYGMVVFDDGSGPALYVCGRFGSANDTVVHNVARWDGASWSALTGSSGTGVDWWAFDLEVFDDGTGPALYIGGLFNSAGGVTANGIARWDGTEWSVLSGPGGTGVGGAYPNVRELEVFDDGTGPALYVAGRFDSAGGVTANNIARWDGTAWSALGSGVSGNMDVRALAVFDDGNGEDLYVGGYFYEAGGLTVNKIARWDGSVWSALDDGSGHVGLWQGGSVQALVVHDEGSGPALYVGGWFRGAGGVSANHIVRWDGASWDPVGGGPGGSIDALAVFHDGWRPALYAANSMATVSRWDGTRWQPVVGTSGSGVEGFGVRTFCVYDDGSGPVLYAGGQIWSAQGAAVDHIARWDGVDWSSLSSSRGAGIVGYGVYALADYDDGSGSALFAGGSIWCASGFEANNIVRWDGSSWSPLSTPTTIGLSNTVGALGVYDDGSGPGLYAGGSFYSAGGVTVRNVARWDGTTWSPLSGPSGTGVAGSVHAFAVFDDGTGPALYVGGYFQSAGGVTVKHVAQWDGTTWTALIGPLGEGPDGYVDALAVFDDGNGPALYAGGDFDTAGEIAVNGIAKWDGVSWHALSGPGGTGVAGGYHRVEALEVFDDGSGPALFVGGSFDTAGGVEVNNIARWDGTAWSNLGAGMSASYPGVLALEVFDDGSGQALYAGGWFDTAGGEAVNHIARWDGTSWTGLSGPLGTGVNDDVLALAVFDDGVGPGLFVGGRLTTAGGLASSRIAVWHHQSSSIFSDDFESGGMSEWSAVVP